MTSLAKLAITVVAAVVLFAIAWVNLKLHAYPKGATTADQPAEDVLLQLNNIGRRLRAGEGRAMQEIFPEGSFFSHLLYGFAWINVGLTSGDPGLRLRAAAEARWVLMEAETPLGRSPFQMDTQVPNGVFYLGWKNRLLGGLLKMLRAEERRPEEIAAFHTQCEQLARAFRASPTVTLDAYPGQAWPCDNAMALASLKLHDELFRSSYQTVIADWVAFTKRHLDSSTGLIVHQIDRITGEAVIAPRGSSQVYLHTLLPELDADFAREQYAQFRRLFVVDWGGYLPVREYPIGVSGRGDVDSGPLIFGISPSATAVAIAAARANSDRELCERNAILSETIGFPWRHGSERSFAFGKILVADAFLAWGKSFTLWSAAAPPLFPPTTSPGWRVRLQAVSAILSGLLLCTVVAVWRRPRKSSQVRRP